MHFFVFILAVCTACAATPFTTSSTYSDKAPKTKTLYRRADDIAVTWQLTPLYSLLDGTSVSSWAVPVDLVSDYNNGAPQPDFELAFDTGSTKVWVHSDLISRRNRHEGRVFRTSSDMYHGRSRCQRERYNYLMGSVSVEVFRTSVTVGSVSSISDFEVGAASRITGLFKDLPSSQIGDGMSPPAASNVLEKLGLRQQGYTQFLFVANEGTVSFGNFDNGGFIWLPVITNQPIQQWAVSSAFTNIGDTLFDAYASKIQMSTASVNAYFGQWPVGLHGLWENIVHVSCDLDAAYYGLPDVNIQLGGTDFSVGAQALVGPRNDLASSESGQNWCVSELQPSTEQDLNSVGIQTILGLPWLKQHDVVFDSNEGDLRIGVR